MRVQNDQNRLIPTNLLLLSHHQSSSLKLVECSASLNTNLKKPIQSWSQPQRTRDLQTHFDHSLIQSLDLNHQHQSSHHHYFEIQSKLIHLLDFKCFPHLYS